MIREDLYSTYEQGKAAFAAGKRFPAMVGPDARRGWMDASRAAPIHNAPHAAPYSPMEQLAIARHACDTAAIAAAETRAALKAAKKTGNAILIADANAAHAFSLELESACLATYRKRMGRVYGYGSSQYVTAAYGPVMVSNF